MWVLDAGWSMVKIGANGPKFSCGTPSTGRASRGLIDATWLFADRTLSASRVLHPVLRQMA
ncbi:hypothetical protein [Streptomyces nodosus]|uniref:hypothetical protein n=1 Tax=Streptomyces nodosus TaxID=40318 RepID=UPI0037F1FE06